MPGRPALAILSVTALLICAASASAGFTDVTAASGIDYVHSSQAAPDIAVYSAPLAAVDVDGDGWTDIVAGRADAGCLLFMNNGDGTFREEAGPRGLAGITGAGGIVAGDFTNSGREDLFIVPLEGSRCFFLANDGSGHFSEVAVERGASLPTAVQPHRGFSATAVDYDRDGYLDIYFTEWGVPSSTEDSLHSALLHNGGAANPGHFENRTAAAGLTQPRAGDTHYGYSAAWADFDEDGWPDLALIADFGRSQLWWNNGNGTFTEQTKASGLGADENGMGVAVADYDGDGRLDLFVSSIFDPVSYERSGFITGNKLYRNVGNRRFEEVAATAGVDRTGWGWGAAFLDSDNNGIADLVVTNGITNGLVPDPNIPASNAAETDPTTLFLGDGSGHFTNATAGSGITDSGQGRAVVVLDYDNDGDEDLLISNAYGHPILYRNDAPANGQRWLRLRFRGSASNRDGIGAVVRITAGGRTQARVFNPSNAYLGQREAILHFGLGNAGSTVDSIEITWPSGIVQTLTGFASNQSHLVFEPGGEQSAPVFTAQPSGGTFAKDQAVTLSAAATGDPAPVFVWEKDGVAIPGATSGVYRIARVHPADAGSYTIKAINPKGTVTSSPAVISVTANIAAHSVARWWDEALLDAIRADFPAPTIHARNLYHVSAAMWDAFWAYDSVGWARAHPVFHREPITADDWIGGRESAQRQAISYAAYRVLVERYKGSAGRDRSMAGFRWLMQQLGYDPDFTGTTGNSPAAVGNRIGAAVLAATLNDGSNEANGYADTTGYAPRNDPLSFAFPGTTLADPNHWQPLAFENAVTQNGIIIGRSVQSFVGVGWRLVTPFALVKPTPSTIAIDPGPPPMLGTSTEQAFKDMAVEVIRYSSMLDPADGATVDISPGAILNNSLGANDGTGHAVNPVTGTPYGPNVVKRADYGRVLAEFWADGPSSETPPGHWNVLHNQVSDAPAFERRFGGVGPELSALEWDVCAYLALNGALHDAAIAAWTLKREYDSVRPISMIRYMGGLGQSSQPAGPSYNPQGLPLVPGLIEVVTAESSAPGQRHAALANRIGKIALRAWRGGPADPASETGGVGWILADNWVPYQKSTFVTPAFPGYISGHSTFSRAGAEVMARLTGTPYFPGGLGTYSFKADGFLVFEKGPSSDITLQWATYYDASDQAGVSRLWGGIHVSPDDFVGRRLGSEIGRDAFALAQELRDGTGLPPAENPTIDGLNVLAATQPVATGHDAAFSIGAAAVDSVKWQVSTDGGDSWADVADDSVHHGAHTGVLELVGVGDGFNGRRYRYVVTAGGNTVTGAASILSVTPALVPMPVGIAVDSAGGVFVSDVVAQLIQKIDAQSRVSSIAGARGSMGMADGAGDVARFNEPSYLALAGDGTLTVTDTGSGTVRRVTPSRVVTTLAGLGGSTGAADGTASSARFRAPLGIAEAADGTCYVADQTNHTIRRIGTDGLVTTIAGSPGNPGSNDGTGSAAGFHLPAGVALDAQGNLYVADSANHTIRKVTGAGVVTTLAGFAGVAGASDGQGAYARFNRPAGVAVDSSGNVYVADTGNSTVRRITAAGAVSTVAGLAGVTGLMDGAGGNAWFHEPEGIAVDGSGTLYVADTGNAAVRRISPSGVVTTYALAEAAGATVTPPVTPPPTPPPANGGPSGGGGGGGGAPSVEFIAALACLAVLRVCGCRRISRFYLETTIGRD